MARQRWLAILLAAALATLVAIPGPALGAMADEGGHGAHFRIGWLANDPFNAYDNAILAGIEGEAAKSHSTVDPFFAGFDPSTQLAQCDQALQSDSYDALVIIAADPIGIEQCVSQAREQGVPVAAVDLVMGPDQTTVQPQLPGQVAASFIPASRFGEIVAATVPEACAGLDPCNIFYLAGLESFPVEQYGLSAVQQAADASPSINLTGHGEAFYDRELARQLMAEVLVSHPEINMVIGADQMVLGAEQAAAEAGVSLRIVGAGAGTTAVAAVREGRWFATFNFLPRTEGEIVTRLLVHALRNKKADPKGIDPVEASGLPVWWTQQTLAQHPEFVGEWPGP